MSRATLRARLEAATPGEWEWAGPIEDIAGYLSGIQQRTDERDDAQPVAWTVQTPDPEDDQGGSITPAFCGNGPRAAHNAALIAHARQDLPALLDVADAAAALLRAEDVLPVAEARLRAALDELEALP